MSAERQTQKTVNAAKQTYRLTDETAHSVSPEETEQSEQGAHDRKRLNGMTKEQTDRPLDWGTGRATS